MKDRYIALLSNEGFWHVVDQSVSLPETNTIVILSNRNTALAVCDDLNAQQDIYDDIRARRDNMSSPGNHDYEI